ASQAVSGSCAQAGGGAAGASAAEAAVKTKARRPMRVMAASFACRAGEGASGRLRGLPDGFFIRLMTVVEDQNVARLTVQRLADRGQGREADGLGLAGLED